MPAIGFKYPDGGTVTFEEVRSGKVEFERMGMSIPTLYAMMDGERDPGRKPSTTELLNGTLQSYLSRTKDFFIDPQSRAFALTGTMHHAKLEHQVVEGMDAEVEGLEECGITGIMDLYDEKNHILMDYKNSGSYKVQQALGLEKVMVDDPSGARYKRDAKYGKKGEIKKVPRWFSDPLRADLGDWTWQLNWYRYMLEKAGKPVEKMFIQVTVRDGGLRTAYERGVSRSIYLLEVPFINDKRLLEFYLTKRDALLHALETNEVPSKCTDEETWNGLKCQRFCEVRHLCPYMQEEE